MPQFKFNYFYITYKLKKRPETLQVPKWQEIITKSNNKPLRCIPAHLSKKEQ